MTTTFRKLMIGVPAALLLTTLGACSEESSTDAPAPVQQVEDTGSAADASPVAASSTATTTQAPASGGANWDVLSDDSTLNFTFSQGGDTVEGQFRSWKAVIVFDESDLENASAEVMVDIDSMTTGSSDRDSTAKGSDWFNTREHTTATFTTTAFRRTAEGTYEADANLTIKGTTNPITLPFTLDIEGDSATMNGEVTIDRTQWGVGDSGDVSDEVTVIVDLTATRG